MIFLHDPVNVAYGGADEECEDQGDHIVTVGPAIYIDGVEDEKKRESPRYAVDDGTFTHREELINHITKEEWVYHTPNIECIWSTTTDGLAGDVAKALNKVHTV